MGMRQRLGLASALLGDPQILVLDEPLNGLDPQGIRWLRTLLRERAAGGKTVLLSSHVLMEAAQTVDDVVVIHHGRLRHQGSIEDLQQLGDAGVFASTPTRERLATAAVRAGGRVELQNGGGRLLIEGIDASQIGELAQCRAHRVARTGAAQRLSRGCVLQSDRRHGGSMTALIRGELIKVATTRTWLTYTALGAVLWRLATGDNRVPDDRCDQGVR